MDKTINPTHTNIELTTACPLHCPQCYCSLQGGKHIPLERAIYWLNEAGKMGVKHVALSGGESMCYPHLNEVIKEAAKNGINSYVATSGAGFTQTTFQGMTDAGLSGLYISLNGSTEEINSITRDGYTHAINALRLIKTSAYHNVTINWVMHASNVEDFPNMVDLAETYEVENIVIIGFKPDAKHEMKVIPSYAQMQWLLNYIKSRKTSVKIAIESCYSPFRALALDTVLFGNLNIGVYKGCRAGICSFSVNVDGELTPCRHLDFPERTDTLEEYWTSSKILTKIRETYSSPSAPCNDCKFGKNCRHCLAINNKLHGILQYGYQECPIAAASTSV